MRGKSSKLIYQQSPASNTNFNVRSLRFQDNKSNVNKINSIHVDYTLYTFAASTQVLPTDRLPQEICRKCCRCVLAFHQLYDSCAALHDRWLNDVLTNATATAATAHQPNPFACPFCENSSDTPAAIGDQAQLQSHLRDQHFDRIFHCDVCAEVVDLRNLMPHMTEHARHMGNGDVVDVAAKGDPDEGNKPEVTIHRRSNVDEDCDDDSCPSQKGCVLILYIYVVSHDHHFVLGTFFNYPTEHILECVQQLSNVRTTHRHQQCHQLTSKLDPLRTPQPRSIATNVRAASRRPADDCTISGPCTCRSGRSSATAAPHRLPRSAC